MKIKMNNAVGPQVRSAKPKPSKLLPILGGVSLVGGLQAATQFFAYTFQYHASLGANLGHGYAPWSILHWTYKWYSQYPDEIMKAGKLCPDELMAEILGEHLDGIPLPLLQVPPEVQSGFGGAPIVQARAATRLDPFHLALP